MRSSPFVAGLPDSLPRGRRPRESCSASSAAPASGVTDRERACPPISEDGELSRAALEGASSSDDPCFGRLGSDFGRAASRSARAATASARASAARRAALGGAVLMSRTCPVAGSRKRISPFCARSSSPTSGSARRPASPPTDARGAARRSWSTGVKYFPVGSRTPSPPGARRPSASDPGLRATCSSRPPPARSPLHGVYRVNELATARAAHAAGISPEIVHAEPGALVMRWVDGQTLEPSTWRRSVRRGGRARPRPSRARARHRDPLSPGHPLAFPRWDSHLLGVPGRAASASTQAAGRERRKAGRQVHAGRALL